MTGERGAIFVDEAPSVSVAAQRAGGVEPASDHPVRPDASWLDAFAANWRLAEDDDEYHQAANTIDGWRNLEESLVALGNAPNRYRFPSRTIFNVNPFDAHPGFQDAGALQRKDQLWRDVETARRRNPAHFRDIPQTRDEFEIWIARRGGRRDQDIGIAAQGGVGTQILPNLAMGVLSAGQPENLPFLAIGGGGSTTAGIMARQIPGSILGTALATPATARARDAMGEGYSGDQLLQDAAIGAASNALLAGGMHVATNLYGRTFGGRAPAEVSDAELARALEQAVPADARTPEQAAALHVLTRQAEVDSVNPYVADAVGLQAHANRLAAAMDQLDPNNAPPPARSAPSSAALSPAAPMRPRAAAAQPSWRDAPPPGTPGDDYSRVPFSAVRDRIVANEAPARVGGYNAIAYNTGPASNAAGVVPPRPVSEMTIGQVFDFQRGPMRARTRGRRGPKDVGSTGVGAYQFESLTLQENARLTFGENWRDMPFSPANQDRIAETLYNRVRGQRGALGTTWAAFAPGRRQAAGDAPTAAMVDVPAAPVLRPDAMDAVRPLVTGPDRSAIPMQTYRAADLGVDAELMQFKSGGDAAGVTDRLQGVRQWDPMAAGMVTVWEPINGRPLIADGHQRHGLAMRMMAADPTQDISLPAFVLREADGFTARDARVLTALKNIGEGSGTAADAARVFREAGPELLATIEAQLPPRSSLVRDGRALAQLSPDAFGAIVNDVIPEPYGAAIGALAPDPATHIGLVDLLVKTDPPNRRQAESIIRQAMAAGFHRETQNELFGAADSVTALFAQRARVLDRTLGELRKMKGAFSVAARNADALEGAGNRIDVAASTLEAAGNARALGIIDRLAYSKGPVSDILNTAARRIADGEPLATVVRDTVRAIRALDLDTLARGDALDVGSARSAADDGAAGGAIDGAGASAVRGGSAADAVDEAGRAYEGIGPDELTPAERDALEAAGQTGFDLFDTPAGATAAKAFDDPVHGDGVTAVADSLWHDIDAEAAALPTGSMFDLDDGRGARSLDDIRNEIDSDLAAVEAARRCL